MKLAILGTDPELVTLVEAAVAAGHQFVWLGDVRPEDAAVLNQLVSGLTVSVDWESLLDHGLVDAVLVGRGTAGDALRAEQLKRLVADIMPVLAVHPMGTSVLVYYEVDMARHEVHGVLRHYSPLGGLPALTTLADWVHSGGGPIGAVHQIILQRPLADCGRESVFRHLARDVEVLRTVAGGVRTVNAVGPRIADATYASLQVQMTCPGAATLRWSIAPTTHESPPATLTLIGATRHGPTAIVGQERDFDHERRRTRSHAGDAAVRRAARGHRRARRRIAGQRHRAERSSFDLASRPPPRWKSSTRSS